MSCVRLCARRFSCCNIDKLKQRLANNGNVVIALKTPYDDGTTHVVRRRPAQPNGIHGAPGGAGAQSRGSI